MARTGAAAETKQGIELRNQNRNLLDSIFDSPVYRLVCRMIASLTRTEAITWTIRTPILSRSIASESVSLRDIFTANGGLAEGRSTCRTATGGPSRKRRPPITAG